MINLFRLSFMILLLVGFFCNIPPNTHASEEYREIEKDHFRVKNRGWGDTEGWSWFIEPAGNEFCRIRNAHIKHRKHYLTMTSRHSSFHNEFDTDYLPLNEGLRSENQLWTFELNKNYSFKIRSGLKVEGNGYFLEFSRNEARIVCKPNNRKESLQIWEIYPTYEGKPKLEDLPRLEVTDKRIPDFKGSVYMEGDWYYYNRYTSQYATTSYPRENTSPFMLAYPRDVNDIVLAIEYAQNHSKKVLARSGGHHYSGKSSGGKDTILLDMYYFDQVKQNSDPSLIEVGPSVKLKDLAYQFNNWGITIPHGECPFVNIGGHAQTGGYGHLLRSFGLALDRVQAFDIVLANESAPLTVTRPSAVPSTEGERFNQALFRGVLGGNAGSFGIVTNYIFKCIRNTDYPASYGFSRTRTYNGEVFRKLMKEVQKWTVIIKENKDAEELEGLDLMMTVESKPFPSWIHWLNGPLMGIELVDSTGKNINSVYVRSIVEISRCNMSHLDWRLSAYKPDFDGRRTLSNLSNSFVRRWPFVTTDGREFAYPYKKRVNGTVNALNDEFLGKFIDKIEDVFKETCIHIVVQMGMGGGACRAKGNDNVGDVTVTSIPHRDFVYNFVFDLFYENGYEERAKQLQEEMQDVLKSYRFNEDSKERRYFWGSFGITDISNPDIRSMYYDDEIQYQKLQELKGIVDPKDIFHSEMTVKLLEAEK